VLDLVERILLRRPIPKIGHAIVGLIAIQVANLQAILGLAIKCQGDPLVKVPLITDATSSKGLHVVAITLADGWLQYAPRGAHASPIVAA
jgi:hypothetical protein